ncbi:MAG: hypothetical protein ACON4Z_02355 [Planctomycetota bacterium]
MASSPRRETPAADVATQSDVAFALQELNACWSQAYADMTRGQLDSVGGLLDQAEQHLTTAGDGRGDSAAEARLRRQAARAHARLQHAMQTGLDGIREELGKQRKAKRALRGYDRTESDAGSRVLRNV